jgi:guanylate kinase
MQRMSELRFSISYTTRKQRATEQDGRDYFFLDHAQFERMIAADEFLEHAKVFDNYYGTSRAQVEKHLAKGENVLLEIDWQGAQQIRRAMPDHKSIFILPPTRDALAQRLQSRQTDSPEVIARRLRDSIADMSHWKEFNYVVVNDDFARATDELCAIVSGHGEHLRADRADLQTLLRSLLG